MIVFLYYACYICGLLFLPIVIVWGVHALRHEYWNGFETELHEKVDRILKDALLIDVSLCLMFLWIIALVSAIL